MRPVGRQSNPLPPEKHQSAAICTGKLHPLTILIGSSVGDRWLRSGSDNIPVAYFESNHFINPCLLIVNWTYRKKNSVGLVSNHNIIERNAFHNVVLISVISFSPVWEMKTVALHGGELNCMVIPISSRVSLIRCDTSSRTGYNDTRLNSNTLIKPISSILLIMYLTKQL